MELQYTVSQLMVYLLLYSFLGWAAETVCIAISAHRYVNRGLLNLPLALPYGITAVILLLGLPGLDSLLLQYLFCLVVFGLVSGLCDQFVKSISGKPPMMAQTLSELHPKLHQLVIALIALVCQAIYLVVHPVLFGSLRLLPAAVSDVLAVTGAALIAADFFGVRFSLRKGKRLHSIALLQERTDRLSGKIASAVCTRLDKAYPGILTPDPSDDGDLTFARGICFDKLVWVFLITSFLGALIEMVYCRLCGGAWMSRSSLLYGVFSVVWGFGAVVLTVVLQPLAGKPDRRVFLAGFFIGGAYEYLCSVLSELVFGTVFWDYSHMPLNIGGRTNVVYCIFWGILAVVWLNMLYPRMSAVIELTPAVAGKIMTWVIVVVMACDCILTAGAMMRYTDRQTSPAPDNVVEVFLDERYDDPWMESRWPNMKRSG